MIWIHLSFVYIIYLLLYILYEKFVFEFSIYLAIHMRIVVYNDAI